MNVLRFSERDFGARVEELIRASILFDATIEGRARTIVDAVRSRGDEALTDFTRQFQGLNLTPDRFSVTQAELLAASLKADESFRQAVAAASANIATFARKSLRHGWTSRNAQGGVVGEKFDPFERVGIYIPGGTAPLVSTALMTITLARVAGCPQIIACTPCDSGGEINAALLFAIRAAGATEIYRIGGAQAIAAMAYGTATIPRVQKIFGPGNAYVVAAKRLLFGHVAIDLLPGPSEVLVLADDSANPEFIAADLLAQAEHGSGHERVWLVTPSAKVLRAVEAEVKKQLLHRSRREFITAALTAHGALIQTRDLDEAVRLVNRLAPEHCEIMTRRSERVAERIVAAGAIFLGPWSPTVLGDYVAGPSHTLPTGGAGVSFAGLTVDQFQRRTSIVRYDAASLKKSIPAIQKFAEMEGLEAHGASADIRFESRRSRRKK